MLVEIKKNKRVLLEDEALDFLKIWTVASSLDFKGKKSNKFFFLILANWLFFPNTQSLLFI